MIVITNFELDVPSPGLLYFPKLRDHFPFIAQSFAKLRRRLSLAARMKGETTQRRCEHQAALLRRRVQRGVCPFLGRGRVGGQGRGRGGRVPGRPSRTSRYLLLTAVLREAWATLPESSSRPLPATLAQSRNLAHASLETAVAEPLYRSFLSEPFISLFLVSSILIHYSGFE